MPYGSMRLMAAAMRCGRKAVSTRPPSSGGIGNRLKAATTTFTITPARAIWPQNGSWTCAQASPITTSAQMNACARLLPGPASATHMPCQRGLRRWPNTTGTGLAKPNTNCPAVRK
ncbi:hypothetical protein D3C81_1730500 [compost metagenome]